ncbi:MAG: membrane protein insertion efficiency factor YidD [Mariniblastus sp.]|nr:membrane protein insertion efficiency factor YidD [Mariniblastus sp.]
MKKSIRMMLQMPASGMIFCVRMYQVTLSPLLGRNCRFTPTCSNYFIQSVRKYGAIRGAWKGGLRICRCHPFHRGGHDPP